MRVSLLSLAFIAVSSIAGSGGAESFTFTPTGGAPTTFTLDAASPTSLSAPFGFGYSNVVMTSGGATNGDGRVQFFDADNGILGGIDFYIYDAANGISSYYNGAKLYAGDAANATFVQGMFQLTAGTNYGYADTATLVIGPDAGTGVTPEPSSLILLGTGLVGALGALRRRG